MYTEKERLIVNCLSCNRTSLEVSIESRSVIENIEYELEDKLVVNPGNRFFFMPGCNVPRFKIRNILKNYSSSISKTFEGGDLVVISDDTFKYLFRVVTHKRILKSHFLEFLSKNNVTGAFEVKEVIEKSSETHVYTDLSDFWKFSKTGFNYSLETSNLEFDNIVKLHEGDEDWNEEEHPLNPVTNTTLIFLTSDENYKEISTKFLNNSDNKKIIYQDDLLKIINENNTFIDEEKYEEIRNMCMSDDKGNSVLAMEIMSNCDYDASYCYIMRLLLEFGKSFYTFKEKNHVNFKSLLDYVGFKPNDLSDLKFIDFIQAMKNKGKFTKENCDILFPYFVEEFKDNRNYGNTMVTNYTNIIVVPIESQLDKEEGDDE